MLNQDPVTRRWQMHQLGFRVRFPRLGASLIGASSSKEIRQIATMPAWKEIFMEGSGRRRVRVSHLFGRKARGAESDPVRRRSMLCTLSANARDVIILRMVQEH